MSIEVFGMLALFLLIADLAAVMSVQASACHGTVKATWMAMILGLPMLGLTLWLVFGPRPKAVVFAS